MSAPPSWPRVTRWATTGLLLTTSACGDPAVGQEKLDLLDRGIAGDSLFRLIGEGPMTATGAEDAAKLFHGYRVSREVVGTKAYAIIFLRKEPGAVNEPLNRTIETPIVLDSQLKVLGWGWSFYDREGDGKFREASTTP